MAASESTLSHRQHIVSQLVRNDSDAANLLFELLVLTDASTPIGAAAHADVLHELYVLTPECYEACKEKQDRLRAANL